MAPSTESSHHSTSATPNWKLIRRDFPILDQEVDGHRLAYLDSTASSQLPLQTIERMSYHQTKDHSNVHRGVHTLSQRSTDALEETRRLVACFINAYDPVECIFVRGVTEGINLVAYTLRSQLKPGDNIVLTMMEHHSNIVPWYILKETLDIDIRVVDIRSHQEPIYPEDVAKLVDERTRLVGCIHVSNALGTINDVEAIISAVKTKNPETLVLIDGCQATLHLPIDVQKLNADFYVFSAHKMCAPTGIGVLWGRKKILEELPPFMGGGDMILSVAWDKIRYNELPHKFEAGTPAILPIIGFGESIQYLAPIRHAIHQREAELGNYFVDQMKQVKDVQILGPTSSDQRVATFSVVFDRVHPHDVGTILGTHGVAIRAGHHCTQPLMTRLGLPATARASIAFYNNFEDIDQFVHAAQQVREIFK